MTDKTPRTPVFYLLCLVILVAALLSCFCLDRFGRDSRSLGAARRIGKEAVTPLVVASPEEAYRAWKARGFRGRTVLFLADGWDRLDPNQFAEPQPRLSYPIKTYRIADRLESQFLGPKTFLYLASVQGIARRIVAVLSPANFEEARQAAQRAKNARVETGTVYQTHQGFPRWFATLDGLPEQREPVLLYVAASAFRSYRPEQLLQALIRRGIRTDAALLCTLAADRDVSRQERLDLERFAFLLQRGGA